MIYCFEYSRLFALKINYWRIMNTSTLLTFPLCFLYTVIFVCMYTMKFIFFRSSKFCILGLLYKKEGKWTSSFPPIELNERSDTWLTYFPYHRKSNSAAPLSCATERHSLIYTNVKRSQRFAQFKWFSSDRNWFILHNSKLLKANVFFIKNSKEKWYWAKEKKSKKQQQIKKNRWLRKPITLRKDSGRILREGNPFFFFNCIYKANTETMNLQRKY